MAPAPVGNVLAGQAVTQDSVSTDRYMLLLHSLHLPASVHLLQSVMTVHAVHVRPVTPPPVGNVMSGQGVTQDSLSTARYLLFVHSSHCPAV